MPVHKGVCHDLSMHVVESTGKEHMAKITVPTQLQAEAFQISPDYVRISMAAAIALGLKSGRVYREAHCECINLIENYPEGCYANCSYCGMARERPGVPEENTFIRVAWPLYETRLVAERIAAVEGQGRVGRVCVSQVQDSRANEDLICIIQTVRRAAPAVPISALANATTLDTHWLTRIREAGVDMIGFGLDAASEELFDKTRGRGVRGPHDWKQHWGIILAARDIYGPLRVNCHIIAGLGETERDLVDLFYRLRREQIAGYLFSFNPEPGSAMQHAARQPITRWRRVQLVKYLIENSDLQPGTIEYDASGNILRIGIDREALKRAIDSGLPFMTNGCPNRAGTLACNRPYGSYRPGEEFRDYPFIPTPNDIKVILQQLGWDA